MTPEQLARRAEKNRQYYWNRREEVLAKRKEFVAANHERLLATQATYRAKKRADPEKAAQSKKYFSRRYEANRDAHKAQTGAWYRANQKKVLETARAYANRPDVKVRQQEWRKKHYEANKQKIIERAIKWRRDKCQQDPVAAIENRMRNRVYHALRAHFKGTARGAVNTTALVGCSMPELAAYLESQFLPGMTWQDRRKWHIDHKRPCSTFNLSDPAQQRACFHYTNLQPLWAADNLRKSSHWEGKHHNSSATASPHPIPTGEPKP